MIGYLRNLKSNIDIEQFAENVLDLSENEVESAVRDIADEEVWVEERCNYPTSNAKEFRDRAYRDDNKRKKLRELVVKELFEFERLEDEDETRLGKGGAKPIGSQPKDNKICCLIIGLPASGKSGIANVIADKTGSYLIDSDLAKRKLPEFLKEKAGASLVHDESTEITDKLLDRCMKLGYNIVYPKIGNDFDSIKNLCETFKSKGYEINLTLVGLDRKLATQRAYNRFRETGRYIPLSLIYDGYANDPTLTYFKMRQQESHLLSGYAHLDSNVEKGERPNVVEKEGSFIGKTKIKGGI
ncbi:MAG: zeta toxin family protein [Oscillospiraceae bacterium]|nr:zeta toxin family protein [Oscillospiraceae bacterium]